MGLKSKIVALLYANGCAKEDVDMLVQNGTLADVKEYVDMEDLLWLCIKNGLKDGWYMKDGFYSVLFLYILKDIKIYVLTLTIRYAILYL